MSSKIVLGAVAATLALGVTNAWLNLGYNPLRAVGTGCST